MVRSFELVGAPCTVRGPYTFYKAFKYTKNDITNIIAINEFFFVKLWNDSDLISIGELRLLWEDKNYNVALASLRLYILPENTPEGRSNDIHGEDEVLAITEKVVIKLDDLLTWITEASDWSWGMGAVWRQHCIDKSNSKQSDDKVNGITNQVEDIDHDEIHTLVDCTAVDYSDVYKEKKRLYTSNWNTRTGVVVLSYSRYCRYRGLLKRLEGVHNEWLRNRLVTALGGFTAACRTTKILFCKDTFDYPELEGHELLCNHLAPKLKNGTQKKKKILTSPEASESESSYGCSDDENDEQSSSVSSSTSINSHKNNVNNRSTVSVNRKQENARIIPVNTSVSQKIMRPLAPEDERKQKAFIQNLYSFMKARLTPIGRLPQIGNREINLFEFFNKVKHLGGHSSVTNQKRWRIVFEELGGEQGNPAAPTLARKHYEKFLLPYELHMAQQFKHSTSQYSIKQPTEASNHSQNGNKYDRRLRVDGKKQVNEIKTNHEAAKSGAAETPGDKENIPSADRQFLLSNSEVTCEVIDLCSADDSNSSGGVSQATTTSLPKDVINLCEEFPIKRSVPSIAATLIPKRRKLDILKEGGLEVTPVSVTIGNSSSRDSVTITRKTVSPASHSGERRDSEDVSDDNESVEILEPEDYSSSKSASNQVLDLRTVNNDWVSYENNLVKNISPSLGPNIEISLVPNDGVKRDEKRQRSNLASIPALRRISTGEVSARNFNNSHQQRCKNAASTGSFWKSEEKLNDGSKQSVFSASVANARARFSSVPPYASNVNQSLYLAALYNSIFPNAAASDFIDKSSTENEITRGNRHQLGLSHQQLSCLKSSFLHSQRESDEQDFDDKTIISNAFAQKFSNILKNNTISIIENYEKILPD